MIGDVTCIIWSTYRYILEHSIKPWFTMNNPCIVPTNSRGSIVLLYENYRYVRNWKSANKQIWRRMHTGCRVYLHTNLCDFTDNNAQINGKFAHVIHAYTYFLSVFHTPSRFLEPTSPSFDCRRSEIISIIISSVKLHRR